MIQITRMRSLVGCLMDWAAWEARGAAWGAVYRPGRPGGRGGGGRMIPTRTCRRRRRKGPARMICTGSDAASAAVGGTVCREGIPGGRGGGRPTIPTRICRRRHPREAVRTICTGSDHHHHHHHHHNRGFVHAMTRYTYE